MEFLSFRVWEYKKDVMELKMMLKQSRDLNSQHAVTSGLNICVGSETKSIGERWGERVSEQYNEDVLLIIYAGLWWWGYLV